MCNTLSLIPSTTKKKKTNSYLVGMVVHIYNPSYSGDRAGKSFEPMSLRPAWAT
jgi:hypothetical protein